PPGAPGNGTGEATEAAPPGCANPPSVRTEGPGAPVDPELGDAEVRVVSGVHTMFSTRTSNIPGGDGAGPCNAGARRTAWPRAIPIGPGLASECVTPREVGRAKERRRNPAAGLGRYTPCRVNDVARRDVGAAATWVGADCMESPASAAPAMRLRRPRRSL